MNRWAVRTSISRLAGPYAGIDVPDLLTADRPEILHINLGPQHPSTHGVLRVELLLDGERVVDCQPIIGYLHTGIEKMFEHRTYLHNVTMTDRLDYLNPLGNNLAYALSVEQ